jgi:ATP-dependent Lhr-like helicase
VLRLDDDAARDRVAAAGLDPWAVDNLLAYLHEQRTATRRVPDDRTLVVERFRDELGDWRVVVHSPFGARVHAPWALTLAARFRDRFGVDVQAVHADDGIVVRLPDVETSDGSAPVVADLVVLAADEVEELVTAQLGSSALFAARFRECAARALLLPRRRPGRRQPLWQQRQRAAQLLTVASRYPDFPIVLETVRECLQDVFDVPGLVRLMREVASHRVRVVEVETPQPSPFAHSLLFGYVAQFLYEGDSPLAERRAAALALDPTLLAEILGRGEGAALRDLLDPGALARTESELQRLVPSQRVYSAEGVADLLRALGPLTTAEVVARTTPGPSRDVDPGEPPAEPGTAPAAEVERWLTGLEADRRVIRVRIAGAPHWCPVEDAARVRDALGTPLPPGIADVFTVPVTDPLGDLLSRHARCHGPFTAVGVAERFGLGPAVVTEVLDRLVGTGRLVVGELHPVECGGGAGPDYCDPEVLRTLRRRSLAALRAEVEPVPPRDLARFLPQWQQVGGDLRGVDGVLQVVEQLSGTWLPASALEGLVLPSRVRDYSPGLLDELTAAGEVLWSGHGPLPGGDGWVALHTTDLAPVSLAAPPPEVEHDEVHRAVLAALASGGAFFFRALSDAVGGPDDPVLVEALWDLVWAGEITNDTLTPLRARLAGRGTAHRSRREPPRARYRPGGRPGLRGTRSLTGRPVLPGRFGPPTAAGRWSLLPSREADPTVRAHATAELLLERYGVLTRGAVAAEQVPGGFAGVYRVLAAMEEAGRVRRGYFVQGLGGAQFGGTGAVDRLRGPGADGGALVLAATDPAHPYGAALPWPPRPVPTGTGPGHRPGRSAGALVVLVDGDLVLYVERGGRSLLSWTEDDTALRTAAQALADSVRAGALGPLGVERADGVGLLTGEHPVVEALTDAGFHHTPRGLRLRG